MNIKEKLKNLSDEKYCKFSSSLIPNCNNMLGVRLPLLRKLAIEIYKEEGIKFLKIKPDFFEEKMLQGMLIGQIKGDLNEIIKYIEEFVPKIDNWAICDSFCAGLKCIKKNKSFFWKFILPYAFSNDEFKTRFFLVCATYHYVDENYLNEIFDILNKIKLNGFYAQMGAAWLISVCFVKFPDITEKFLIKNNLDKITQNKAIQKIIDSYRVSDKHKTSVRKYKII